MGRLTIRTEKGAALKLNNPQNEIEARKQLHDKYLIAIEKLAHYEDMEELGRLIELPCAVGDTVWEVQEIRRRIQPLEIIAVHIGRMGGIFFEWELKDGEGIYKNISGFRLSSLNETVFLTKEEAEAKLEELKGE